MMQAVVNEYFHNFTRKVIMYLLNTPMRIKKKVWYGVHEPKKRRVSDDKITAINNPKCPHSKVKSIFLGGSQAQFVNRSLKHNLQKRSKRKNSSESKKGRHMQSWD